jgi:single-stranded-DNA-specific exonuclease
MGFEEVALKLFLTDNPQEAQAITEELNNFNTKRQEIEKRMFEDAKAQIAKYHMEDDPIIVLGSKEWHHGVIGIVSSKITDLYYKPSILVSFEDGIAKGSGRSIPGFDLHEALGKSSDVLLKYGGHEMAIGINLEESKFDEFREKIIQLAKEAHTDELVPSIKIDKEVTRKDINFETIENLKLLEPYGEANKTPLFIYKNLKIESIRTIAEGKHLKLVLRDDDLNVDAIAFGLGEFIEEFKLCERVDVVVQLEINEYNKNNKIIQFSIKDMRKSI